MKRYINYLRAGSLVFLLGMTACNNESNELNIMSDKDVIAFDVLHPNHQSRLSDTSFEDDDLVGLYLTSHNTPLELSGNYANNAKLSYSFKKWKTDKPIYWNEGTYDVYAYYPYVASPVSVDDFPVAVSSNQHEAANYACSDFLWAGKKNVQASDGTVTLKFQHCMSRLVVQLVKGEDFEGDLPDEAEVYIHSTVPSATADLNVGVVTRNQYADPITIRAKSLGDQRYAAIVVPQRINNRQPLVEVVMKGVSYLYESKFLFKPGVQHNVTLAVSKNPEQVKIEIGGELKNWEE